MNDRNEGAASAAPLFKQGAAIFLLEGQRLEFIPYPDGVAFKFGEPVSIDGRYDSLIDGKPVSSDDSGVRTTHDDPE